MKSETQRGLGLRRFLGDMQFYREMNGISGNETPYPVVLDYVERHPQELVDLQEELGMVREGRHPHVSSESTPSVVGMLFIAINDYFARGKK